ncbi:MAG: hypothetical protein AABY22_28290 [Nanoarchaeota archaeon]
MSYNYYKLVYDGAISYYSKVKKEEELNLEMGEHSELLIKRITKEEYEEAEKKFNQYKSLEGLMGNGNKRLDNIWHD